MNPNGPERRDTSPKGEAIRDLFSSMKYLGLFTASHEGQWSAMVNAMTAAEFSSHMSYMWVVAYAQGRADLAKEMRESLGNRIDEVLGEMR